MDFGTKLRDVMLILVAVWMIWSPFLLHFHNIDGALPTFTLIGTACVFFAEIGVIGAFTWHDYARVIAGLFMLGAPWIFGFHHAPVALWNAEASGLLLVLLAGANLAFSPSKTSGLNRPSHAPSAA